MPSAVNELNVCFDALKKMLAAKKFEKFIHYCVFPNFKNIEPSTRIDFDFPITALVGPNGSGKSSVLTALYGMPKGYTTEEFWFSTAIDAIEEGDGLGAHRYYYGHFFDKARGIVETRKARVTKADRSSEYWEPTKATKGDGMSDVPNLKKKDLFPGRSLDRWNPVEKNVLFLNFKNELSAYDKYMYFGRSPNLDRIKSRQDRIRHDSKLLKNILDGVSINYYYNRPVIEENRLLTAKELKIVSHILGRNYEEARYIKHRMFGGVTTSDGISVIFRKPNVRYSEAHAGSGEVAVVNAVIKILSQPEYSLVLLDEPEVSMHPGAQHRFLKFLAEQAQENKHQIIFSTHSPELIRGLPDRAIKVLEERESGKFSVISETSSSLAFSSIGASLNQKLTIYVEDRIAKHVVEAALKLRFNRAECQVVEVKPLGSANTILSQRIPTFMLLEHAAIIILDGDKKPLQPIPHPDDIPLAQLEQKVKDLFGCVPQLGVDGNAGASDVAKKQKSLSEYLEWCQKNLYFLPGLCPEEIIINAVCRSKGSDLIALTDSNSAKNALYAEMEITESEIESADEIVYRLKQRLTDVVQHCEELNAIAAIIRPHISSLNSLQ